jgi:hypothetical protein
LEKSIAANLFSFKEKHFRRDPILLLGILNLEAGGLRPVREVGKIFALSLKVKKLSGVAQADLGSS